MRYRLSATLRDAIGVQGFAARLAMTFCLLWLAILPTAADRTKPAAAEPASPFAIRGIKGLWWQGLDKYRQALPWLAEHNMNFMMLCYSSFPASGSDWRSEYSAEEMAGFHKLATDADRIGVQVCLSFNPGLWSKPPLAYSSESDYQCALAKVKHVHSLGIHWFALCLDDIGRGLQPADKARFGTLQSAQVTFINRLWTDMKTLSPTPHLIFCPSAYTTEDAARNQEYIKQVGANVDPGVMMFWTGPQVCSPTISAADARLYGSWIGRKPIVWDNYPVNDMFPWRPLMGPVKGRSTDLGKAVSGFIANPMKQWSLSRIPLSTLAEYLKDPGHYSPSDALERALAAYPAQQRPAMDLLVNLYGSSFWGEAGFPPTPRPRDAAGALKMLPEYRKLRAMLSRNSSLKQVWMDAQPAVEQDITALERKAGVLKRASPLVAQGNDFSGGAADLYGYSHYGRTVNYVYARSTGRHRMEATFTVARPWKQGASLLLTARDDDSGKKLPVRITFNDLVLSNGDSPFNSADFSSHTFAIPASALKPGINRLIIENLVPEGPSGNVPWFMAAEARIRVARSQE